MKMNSKIIKISGKMPQIVATLKTLNKITGQGATLSDLVDLVDLVRHARIKRIFQKGW